MILTPKHGKFALEEWDLSGENADLPHEESVISPQVSTEPSENWGSFTNKKSGFTQLSWGYDRMTQTGDATKRLAQLLKINGLNSEPGGSELADGG